MDVPKQTQEKIGQLQLLEQNMQNLNIQKQNYQTQLLEVESALKEIDGSPSTYKIIGSIMVFSDKNKLKQDLESTKELLDVRLSTIDKQESKFREQATKLQSDVLKDIKK